MEDRALSGAARSRGRARDGRSLPGSRRARIHGRVQRRHSTASPVISAARAIPARTALKFRVIGADAEDLARALLANPLVKPDRPWRPRHAAPGSRPLPLRPRHRRDDFAGRGRSGLVHRQAPPRAKAAFPAPPAFSANCATVRPAAASVCSLEGRAPAREGCDIVGRGRRTASAASPAARSRPASAAPIAMGYVDADHAGIGTPLAVIIRGAPASGDASCPCHSSRIAIIARPKSGTTNG